MRLDKREAEAVEYLRKYAAAGFPKRADGSWPTDFLTAIRRLGQVPNSVSSRGLERRLVAMPDGDYVLGFERLHDGTYVLDMCARKN